MNNSREESPQEGLAPSTLGHDLNIARSLRKIIRAVDLHSRRLRADYQITGPQLICLTHLAERGETTATLLSKEIHLSASTVVGILDRLEARGLVTRKRDSVDRRVVQVTPTPTGVAMVGSTPSPLLARLTRGLARLPESRRAELADALQEIVIMLEANALDAAPLLETAPIEESVAEYPKPEMPSTSD